MDAQTESSGQPATILVVDDEPSIRRAIATALAGSTVHQAATCAEALALAKDSFPDLVLLDNQLPDGSGLDLVAKLKAIDAELPVVLLTGHGSVDLAVDALKRGCTDFLEKPFKIERLRTTVRLLLDKQALGRQVARLSGRSAGRAQLVAHSSPMKRVLALVKRVAAVPSTTVLIQGESGTGKELEIGRAHV